MYWQLLHRDRILRNYWSGALVSRLGSNMTMIALAWIVLARTHSSLQSGMVYAFASLPVLLGGPVVGTLVDRWSRRRMMLTADIVRAVLIILIPVGWGLNFNALWWVYGIIFVNTLWSLVFGTSERAIMPHLAGTNLPVVNSLLAMTRHAADLMGPVLGGVLVTGLGHPSWVLVLDAGTFVWSFIMVRTLPRDLVPQQRDTSTLSRVPIGLQMKEGVQYLLRHRSVWALGLTMALANVMAGPLENLFLVATHTQFRMKADGFGLLVTALGGGLLFGAWLTPRLLSRWSTFSVIYSGILLFAVVLMCFGQTHTGWLGVVAAMFIGITMSPVNIGITTWLQQRVPSEYRGRVFGLLGSLNQFLSPIAMVAVGWDLQRQAVMVVSSMLAGIGFLVSMFGLLFVRSHMFQDKGTSSGFRT
ncbi:MAG: MFS transporter [Firmicutes bacterium]|nr:MFS transporter [Bacillota bacterium]